MAESGVCDMEIDEVERSVQRVAWSEEQMQIIDDNISYFTKMLNLCNALKEHGRTDASCRYDIPKLPKVSINQLINAKAKPALDVEELHQYLCSKIVPTSGGCSSMPDLTQLPADATLERMKHALKAGYKCLMGKHKYMILCSMQYGKWLEIAYNRFQQEKDQGSVKGSWSTWLKKTVDISEAYARKLREIVRLFAAYQKITQLGIPFSELYSRRRDIFKVVSDESKKHFWSHA